MQPGPPSRKEAPVSTCFPEQQRALQASSGLPEGLTLPACEQVLGMRHARTTGCWLPICCFAMQSNRKPGSGIFSFLYLFFTSPVSLPCSSFFFPVSDKRVFMSRVNDVLWR